MQTITKRCWLILMKRFETKVKYIYKVGKKQLYLMTKMQNKINWTSAFPTKLKQILNWKEIIMYFK